MKRIFSKIETADRRENVSTKHTFQVPPDSEEERLDQWLTAQLGAEASRSLVQKAIKSGRVTGEGIINARRKIQPGETYTITLAEPESSTRIEPRPLDLNMVYEDADLAVLHKPPGIAVHPGPGDDRTSIAHGILHRWATLQSEYDAAGDSAGSEDSLRPGIVHRLDRDTEGLLIVAKHAKAQRLLSEQFARREVRKEYTAWLHGAPPAGRGRFEDPIARHPKHRRRMRIDPAGRSALTEYEVREAVNTSRGRKFCRVDIRLHTGRTHQIRVHFSHAGAPVVGDPLYSRSHQDYADFGMLLLAQRLGFTQPLTGAALEFALELPPRFQDFAGRCRNF